MADSVSKPVSGSIAKFKSKFIHNPSSGIAHDSANKHHTNSKPPHLWTVGAKSSPFPMPDSGIVCTTCARLSYEQLCTPEGQSYHESWTAVAENVAQGCRLCNFFLTVKNAESDYAPEILGQSGSLSLRIHSTNLDLIGSDSNVTWRYGLCLPADIDAPLPEPAKDLKNILRYPDRACEKAIAKIQTWINECETKHPNCRKPMISSLPSRVLDVFPKGSSQSISLVEGKGLKAEYMTLSYCWGKEAENSNGQISTCTSQNISQLFQGISIDVLPPVYRDAITMTQKLGKRYLWIDSLCIIQDSKEDWSKECPRMADIYANSFLTISAASCLNKQEGFIKATMFEMQAKLTTIPGTQGQYIYVRPSTCSTPPTPLMDRAWAFQEKLLSTRVLHLTSLEMVFQCDKRQFGSCGEDCSAHGCGLKSFLWKTSRSQVDIYDIRAGFFDPENTNSIWFRVVEDYADLKLTYDTDRLPALSSIAHVLQRRFLLRDQLQTRYVAGLWDTDLVFGLLWSVRDDDEIKAGGLSSYVAPTWSWASTRETPMWTERVPRNLLRLKVVEVQAHPSTSNPLGEISSASLIVDAPLQRVFLGDMRTKRKTRSSSRFGWLVVSFAEIMFSFDEISSYGILTSKAAWLLPCTTESVLEEAQLRNKSKGLLQWDGLALELVDEKKQVYKRIGLFAICELVGKKRTLHDHVHRLFGKQTTWYDLGFVDTRVTII